MYTEKSVWVVYKTSGEKDVNGGCMPFAVCADEKTADEKTADKIAEGCEEDGSDGLVFRVAALESNDCLFIPSSKKCVTKLP